ncbi:2OG-Fe(II) oxygenase superfamily protein [Colletotrichum graminicola M1.001]|uniref:2OG-Fe(II) oxygenase superfamily protein n=1 Tax=Colletotrichum graminicola (strain M1.001 / M2 / FGSC 10212) TaxID=645133 RepID=E3QZ83_COLGM|nr:2OG-Fe(II) oxygenase superfamily protein [Colletotrichum graminicola M1.001]EFQ36171.1 2OG-Fe(II) oxygenase superfamily protein [Colletotrichum graminicola M1.001]
MSYEFYHSAKSLKFYHNELTPRLLDAINSFVGLPEGILKQLHKESSEVAHFLFYHHQWYKDIRRKRAAYAGHTDIGTITYLYANPVASLQVYSSQGWEYVAYIPNSIVINMGDAMEFITKGQINATLHRVIKPLPTQDNDVRTALIYFVHPNHSCMVQSVRHYQELRARYTSLTRESPGALINGAGLNRVISALSSTREDIYFVPINSQAWELSKRVWLCWNNNIT